MEKELLGRKPLDCAGNVAWLGVLMKAACGCKPPFRPPRLSLLPSAHRGQAHCAKAQ